ncbi:hypothetical protein GWN42_31425 [candidate division KSB1 bacterium]|nr:hypothetical protein [Phycisphaerae bacterium]NIV97181.1 hypothetical protein [candidate division KSB1 bacterium]
MNEWIQQNLYWILPLIFTGVGYSTRILISVSTRLIKLETLREQDAERNRKFEEQILNNLTELREDVKSLLRGYGHDH